MQEVRPTVLLDPVCGMRVAVDVAESEGLLVERDGRTWAFCREACRDTFVADPAPYVIRAEAVEGAPAAGTADRPSPVIDAGFRLWYESCSCCLGDAFPEVKAQLDAERAAAHEAPVADGICVTAEAAETAAATASHQAGGDVG